MILSLSLTHPLSLSMVEAPSVSLTVSVALSSSTVTAALRMWGRRSSTRFSHQDPVLFTPGRAPGTSPVLMVSVKV